MGCGEQVCGFPCVMARVEAAAAALVRPSTYSWLLDGLAASSVLIVTLLLTLLQPCSATALLHDNNSVQPVGSGLEVVKNALGVLDGDVDNAIISSAQVLDSRHKILAKKSHITLSHIFGVKEFFNTFPGINGTHLRTQGPLADFSKGPHSDSFTPRTAVPQQDTVPTSQKEAILISEPQPDVETIVYEGDGEQTDRMDKELVQEEEEEKSIKISQDNEAVSLSKSEDDRETVEEEKEQTKIDDIQPTQTLLESSEETDQHLESSSTDAEETLEEVVPSPEIVEHTEVEGEKATEIPQVPSGELEDLVVTSEETEKAVKEPAETESEKVNEETVKVDVELPVTDKVDIKTEELPGDLLKEKCNQTEKEVEASVIPETVGDAEKPVPDSDTPEEVCKKKKKTSESGKTKKKDVADKSAAAKQEEREEAPDTLETYSQFTQRVNAEKKNDIITNGHGGNGHGKGPKVKSKNYASPDCGAKMLTANPEASHTSKVIHSNKDEYLLNKCRDKTWFIIELCESIRPQKFDIANFELFSNLPKDIHVLGSHRYPSREWSPLARARGQEGNRAVQSFPVETEDFFKYIKVEVLSHYGSEFFCPISLFRIYGLSEFEVIDSIEDAVEDQEETEEPFTEAQQEEKKAKDEGKPSVIPAVIKNMFTGVLDVIKRGYRPHSASSEPGDSCYSLHPKYAVDKRSCQLAESLNYILSCYQSEYEVLIQKPFVSRTVKHLGFCRLLASTMCLEPNVNDSFVYDTACNNSYLCIMLSPKHLLAMCFMHDSNIMKSEMACESNGALLPENFSATTMNILPPENDLPPYVKNAKINTSTITRTDSTIPNVSGSERDQRLQHIQETGTKQIPVEVPLGPEEPVASSPPVAAAETSKVTKKTKLVTDRQQDKDMKETEQQDNTTESEKSVEVEGTGTGGEELEEEKGSEVEKHEEREEEEFPVPVTPLPVESKVSSTSPTNKESVVVRLSNKIKALEYNMSISSQYLEELSRRYKRQMEEMQHQFNLTIAALNATSRQAFERDQHHQRDIEALEEQLASVSAILEKLVEERESLAHTVVEQHLLLMVVEVVVLCLVFLLCHKRAPHHRLQAIETQERRAQTPNEDPSDMKVSGTGDSGGDGGWVRGRVRRRSVDSITREQASQRRCRRPSEEALRISGTYEDLLIIEPTIPIMVDSFTERKKKKKSSSGTLKRSKSNASIVEKSCNPTRRSRCIENLDMSSAGVLFCGDQVEAKAAPTSEEPPQLSPSLNESPDNEVAHAPRSFIDEIKPENHFHNGTKTVISKRHSIPSCPKGMKISKSLSLNSASEKLKNGTEKTKKNKKGKKKNGMTEAHNFLINETDSFHETKRTCYSGQEEHSAEYYYSGCNSVHFSDAGATRDDHIFSADVPDTNSFINGDSSQGQGYVVNDYIHSNYVTNFVDKRRISQAGKVKLRSDNWEWYSHQHFGSSSETVSTCSDSSGKTKKGRCDDVLQVSEHGEDRKLKKKKKSKSKSPVLLEEAGGAGT